MGWGVVYFVSLQTLLVWGLVQHEFCPITNSASVGRGVAYFLKPFLKGKILRSSERGVNSILTTILRF